MLPGLIVGGEMISSFRRNFLSGAAAFVATAALAPVRAQVTAKPKTRLVLLGTGGGPRIVAPGRSKSANLIVANGVPYVVDCGEGVAHQMVRAGVALSALRYIFITHHHSDHNLDYGNLVYDAWAAGLRAAVEAYGPPPIKAMTEAYWQLNRFDIETRIGDESRPDLRKLVTAHEFNAPGLVMQNADVKVTAARARHPPIVHAYAYRFDAADRSIVISGDTRSRALRSRCMCVRCSGSARSRVGSRPSISRAPRHCSGVRRSLNSCYDGGRRPSAVRATLSS